MFKWYSDTGLVPDKEFETVSQASHVWFGLMVVFGTAAFGGRAWIGALACTLFSALKEGLGGIASTNRHWCRAPGGSTGA